MYDQIESIFNGKPIVFISRQDVHERGRDDLEKLILLTIFWGYSFGMRGKNFEKIMEESHDIVALLEESRNGIPDWDEHYKKIQNIEGLGISTYTKFLYFLRSKVNGFDPLILDAKIIRCMQSGIFSELNEFKSITYANSQSFYPIYLKRISNLAKSYEVDSDQIEYFLFLFGQNIKKE